MIGDDVPDPYADDEEERRRREAAAVVTPPGGPVPTNGGIAGPPVPAKGPATQAWTRQNVSETLQRYGAPTLENLKRAVAENPWLGQVAGSGKIQDVTGSGTGAVGRIWDVIANAADPTGASSHWQTLTGNTARAAAQTRPPGVSGPKTIPPGLSGPKTIAPPISGPKTIVPPIGGPITIGPTGGPLAPTLNSPTTIGQGVPGSTTGGPATGGPVSPPGPGGISGPLHPGGPTNLPPGTPPPPGTTPPGTTPPGTGTGTGPQDPKIQALYDTLLARSKQGLAVDRNDPAVRGQADAFSANQTRTQRDYISDLAEKAGPNANIRGEERMAAERSGQASGAFEADLMAREITAKRDEIATALSSMQGLLTFEQQQALTKELALMDDAIKRLTLKQQESQFGRGLDQQKKEFAETMKFRYADLSQQQKQFMLDLGYKWNGRAWEQNPANPANRL